MDEGKGLLPFIEWAQHSLFLTSFTPQQYSREYELAHLSALKKPGLRCERIVSIHPAKPEAFQWLRTFFGKDGKPIGNYTQYHCPNALGMYPDIAIIDNTYVAQIRWSPFDTKNSGRGKQDAIFVIKSPENAAFQYEHWHQNIEAFRLEEIKTRKAFDALLIQAGLFNSQWKRNMADILKGAPFEGNSPVMSDILQNLTDNDEADEPVENPPARN